MPVRLTASGHDGRFGSPPPTAGASGRSSWRSLPPTAGSWCCRSRWPPAPGPLDHRHRPRGGCGCRSDSGRAGPDVRAAASRRSRRRCVLALGGDSPRPAGFRRSTGRSGWPGRSAPRVAGPCAGPRLIFEGDATLLPPANPAHPDLPRRGPHRRGDLGLGADHPLHHARRAGALRRHRGRRRLRPRRCSQTPRLDPAHAGGAPRARRPRRPSSTARWAGFSGPRRSAATTTPASGWSCCWWARRSSTPRSGSAGTSRASSAARSRS